MIKYIVIMMVCFLGVASHPLLALTVGAKQAQLVFRINHDLGYTVGSFKDFTATIEQGNAPTEIVSAKIQVQTASIDTRNSVRDEGLKSALFLDAGKFPHATFESTKAIPQEVEGLLTIKGVTKPITLKIEQESSGTTVFKGTFNRHDYGITYNAVLPNKKKSIGDMVEVLLIL